MYNFQGTNAAIINGQLLTASNAEFVEHWPVLRVWHEVSLTRSNTYDSEVGSDGDPAFGNNGRVVTQLKNSGILIVPRSLVLHTDSRVAVAARFYNTVTGSYDLAIFRFNANGTWDTSLDGDGVRLDDFGIDYVPANNNATAAARSGAGFIIAGVTANTGSDSIALTRYTDDGLLDQDFGFSGRVVAEISAWHDRAAAVAVMADGRIVVAGTSIDPVSNYTNWFVARFLPDGQIDTSFGGGDGVVVTDLGAVGFVSSVVMRPDGGILVGGRSRNSGSYDAAIVAYTSTGVIDVNFSPDGFAGGLIYDLSADDNFTALSLDSQGRLVVAGFRILNDQYQMVVARFNATTGLNDQSFGTTGFQTAPFAGAQAFAFALTVDANDNPILTGSANIGGTGRAAFAKFRASNGTSTPRLAAMASSSAT